MANAIDRIKSAVTELAGPLLGSSELLAVDIGSHAIKVLGLKPEKGGLVVSLWGHIPLDPAGEATPEEKKKRAGKLLKDFLSSKKASGRRAATSVSGNAVIVRYVKLPFLSKTELAKVLPTEAEPFIPFDIKEVQLSCHILGETTEEGQKKIDAVLVAAKRELIQERLDILLGAGLSPVIIDVDSFAIENVHEKISAAQESPGAVLYLNIGHQVTNLSIVEGGLTRVVRDIFISGNTFTKAVQKALQCDPAKAEAAKKAHGLFATPEEKEKALQEGDREALAVSQALIAVVRDMVAEVHRSVDFYLSQGAERSIAQVSLCGGTANLKNLNLHLTAELKVPVQVINPLSFVHAPPEIPDDSISNFTVVAGLALRKMKDWV